MTKIQSLVAALLAASPLIGVTAYPKEATWSRELQQSVAGRDQDAANPKTRELQDRAAIRRSLTAQLLRQKRDIVHKPMLARRDQDALNDWINTCHDQGEELDYDLSTPERTVFSSNNTYALAPEIAIGPNFVAGEYVRSEVTENQEGIPIHLDIQFVDVDTQDPVPNLLVDIWHPNATGVYSGLKDQGGLKSTFLRGVQTTDYEGVAEFDSIYPGHSAGRTNHINLAVRKGGKILSNGTYSGGKVNHIGELYFDEELNAVIENLQPYQRNRIPRTSNAADAVLNGDAASKKYDPFVNYVRLSDVADDGLLLWITIGVNTTADYTDKAVAAATHTKGGGWANNNQTASAGNSSASNTSSAKEKKPTVQVWGPCDARKRK